LVHPRLLVPAALALAAFAALTYQALLQPYAGFDVTVARTVQALPWGPLARLFALLDWFEGWKQVATAGLGLLLVLAVRRRAFWLMVWGVLSGALYQLAELAVHRPRPPASLVHVVRHTAGYSFPSGHAVFFTWIGAYLLLIFARGLPRAVQALLWLFYAVVVLMVCLSRVYTAEHWPSDVAAGVFLGAGWAMLGLSIRRLSDPVLEA
jgi:undecaprenyl-diphosphatase